MGMHSQLANGNLLVVGHPYYDHQAEVQLPPVLDGRDGIHVGDWIDITQGMLPDGWAGGPTLYVGGILGMATVSIALSTSSTTAPGKIGRPKATTVAPMMAVVRLDTPEFAAEGFIKPRLEAFVTAK